MSPLKSDKIRKLYRLAFKLWSVLLLFVFSVDAQTVLQPCINGNQATCRCSTAPLLCTIDELDGVTLRMSNYQHPNDAPNPICMGVTGIPNNPSWLSFTAWCEQLSLQFVLSNCIPRQYNFQWSNGVQVAIYSACGPPNNAYQSVGCLVDANQVCCFGNNCTPPNNMTLNLNNLNIGEVYYMMVDGCGGANCDVTVNVIDECGQEQIRDWVQPIQGNTVICPNESNQLYFIPPQQPNLKYFWYLDGVLIQDSIQNSIHFDFSNSGMYQLCVDVSKDPCVPVGNFPAPACIDIEVIDFQIENPPEVIICQGDSLLYRNQYYKEGIFTVNLQSDQGCDSSIVLMIRSEPIPQTHLGEIRLCQGEVFDFHGVIYDETGSYMHILQKSEEPYCDSIIRFDVNEIMLSAIADVSLDCITNSITVITETNVPGNQLDYEWIKEGGSIWSTDTILITDVPGTYQLRITDILSGCTIESNFFEVIDDRQLPTLEYLYPQGLEINCFHDTLLIIAQTEQNIMYSWIVEGQQFSGNNIKVTQSGEIVFKAFDTLSGCLDSVSFMIGENKKIPVFNLESEGSITCLKTTTNIELNLQDNLSSIDVVWNDEAGIILGENIHSILVGESGMIYVSAFNLLNGCQYEDSIYIEDNRIYPEIEAEVSGVLDCNHLSVILTGKYLGIETNIEWFWKFPDGTTHAQLQIEIDQPGSYFFNIINHENGCETTEEVQVNQNLSKPDLSNFNLSQIRCKGDKGSFEIVENQTDALPFLYILNGKELQDGNENNLGPGIYKLEIIDQNGCISDTVFMLQDGIELNIDMDNWIEIDLGDTVTLNARINTNVEDLKSIQWYPEDFLSCSTCLTPLAIPDRDIMYHIEVSEKNGCGAVEYVFIKVNKEIRVFVPNAFSPNADGINDRFTIFADKLVKSVVSMEIFDRWGNQVFSAKGFPPNDPSFGWDGTFKGQKMQPGTFIYTIEVELTDNSTQRINGGFHLIKG